MAVISLLGIDNIFGEGQVTTHHRHFLWCLCRSHV